MPLQLRPLAAGTGRLDLPSVQSQLRAAEAGLPEGARVELTLEFEPLTLPLYGRVDLARLAAEAVNRAAAEGQLTSGGEVIQPWPEYRQIALYDSAAGITRIRWRKGVPWVPLLVGILIGIALVGGILLYLKIRGWTLSQAVEWVLTRPLGPLPVGGWIVVAALLVLIPPVLGRLQRR